MLNLTKEQMERRNALLEEWKDKGYTCYGRTKNGSVLVGKDCSRKAEELGVWFLKEAEIMQSFDVEEDLFPDAKWTNKEVSNIEHELKKSKFRVM